MRTTDSTVQELIAAHKKWKETPESERGSFSHSWLSGYGLASALSWMRLNGGIDHFVALAGDEVKEDFEKLRIDAYTNVSVLESFEAAHAVWKNLPEAARGRFSIAWLQRNGYKGPLDWMRKNGGVPHFVSLASVDVQRDFERLRVENHGVDTVVGEFLQAHTEWKALPEIERGGFAVWFRKNKPSLYDWMRRNGGFEKFISLAGGDAENDFKREMVHARTAESVLGELEHAYQDWKAETRDRDGAVLYSWLIKNRTSLYDWIRRHGGFGIFSGRLDDDLASDLERRVSGGQEIGELVRLKTGLATFAKEIIDGQSIAAKEFQSLAAALGGSRALDILYKFRPEYKGLPPEYVKGVLADYLGEFLLQPGRFSPGDVEVTKEYLSDLTLREGLFETLKDHCLRYYLEQRRSGRASDSKDIIYGYLAHIIEELGHVKNKDLDDVIHDVVKYYDSIFRDVVRPKNFVESLEGNREFPDVNQRINIKEIAEKKRVLIADEMGLGKSASVIMAKESLNIGCALVIAPSNVIATWERYLSDKNDDGGYFKEGKAPRVLVVGSGEQLEKIGTDKYDYVLISQERMNDRYASALEEADFGMMVVDEVHKLKNPEGERTKSLLRLSQKMEEGEKYVTLLSGTPAPNKVEDIAVTLKLLYPEKFAGHSSRELVQQIIQGDVVDLRALLLPRMQMKKLEESVELPPLQEKVIETELAGMEKEIYDVLLEDDELTAPQKMTLLRQFLLNPDLLDPTPGIESAKVRAVGKELQSVFEKRRKVVMFVNGYIDGVIRGEHNIIQKLELPKDVEVAVIHGENREERQAIEKKFKENPGKMLLAVSGQTADVGVDFTAGEYVLTYNEPWTEYEHRQQIARTYRPGLKHPLEAGTFITANTLEEGIHDYTKRKYIAIEKLLRGVPLQELEKQLLVEDEKRQSPDLEVNQELAEYYFSSWDKLMRIFASVKEIGEQDFQKFLSRFGKEYADCYLDLGNRSYQANANRVAGTLIDLMAKERGEGSGSMRILDLASGPEVLKQHLGDEYSDRVFSIDANPFHFREDKKEEGRKAAVASWTKLPFAEKSFDYLNLALALHYSSFVPSKGKTERLDVLAEANRVLKPGGRAVFNLIYSLDIREPEKIGLFAEALSFRVVEEYSGEVASGDRFRSRVITLEKVDDFNGSAETVLSQVDVKDYGGLKLRKKEGKLKNQRKIIEQFELGGRTIDINFNSEDQAVLEEEQALLHHGEALKERFGGIDQIPKDEVIKNEFVRIRIGKKYALFKKMTRGAGVVIIK